MTRIILAALLIAFGGSLFGCVAYEPPPPQVPHGQRDPDRDGVANRYDRDRDGDGVPNTYDRRPGNPRAY